MRKTIYLAGGCFYGVQAYIDQVRGVISTVVGYVNSKTANPSLKEVLSGNTGAVEAVKVDFDDSLTSFEGIIKIFLRGINPYSYQQQGAYKGSQYRTGIYYTDIGEGITITRIVDTTLNPTHHVEVLPIDNFFPAEASMQNYVKRHPYWNNPINMKLVLPSEKKIGRY